MLITTGLGMDQRAWAARQFCRSDLGHSRRTGRLVRIGEAMARHAGASLPAMFDTPHQVKAAYRFFDTAEATPDAIQSGHRQVVREQMGFRPGTWLLLEDTSEICFGGRARVEGLGPVGPGGEVGQTQGVLLHSVLCVEVPAGGLHDAEARRRPLRVAGLIDQQFRARVPRPKGEGRRDSRAALKRPRESELWTESTRRIGPAPAGARVVRVADRGGDIYEALLEYQRMGHGFTVRAAHDRRMEGARGERMFGRARRAPALGAFTLELRGREGEPARRARLSVSAADVEIRSPQRPGSGAGGLLPIRCRVVRAFEADPPDGTAEPLEWLLLTDQPSGSFGEALDVVLQYTCRWVIEDFHKALKTGMGVERLQMEKGCRLFAAIAVMSLVALRLIDLRERLRLQPDAPAQDAGLCPLEMEVLRHAARRDLATVRDVALAIGRLGGHMNRKGDGMPGWITLWRGMSRLLGMIDGVRIAHLVDSSLTGAEGFG